MGKAKGEAAKDEWYDPDDPDVPPIWEWLAQQHNNTDTERAEAARYVAERWQLGEWYKHRKVLSTLQAEKSGYLHGLRLLTDDYVELFDLTASEQVRQHKLGVVAPLVPVNREQCEYTYGSGKRCTKDSIPGAGRCGDHGGSWISESERADMVKRISERLVDISDRAVTTLADLMDNAKSEHVRYESAVAILDRIGVGPIQKVELDVTPAAEEAAAQIKNRLQELRSRQAPTILVEQEDVVDVEFTESEPEPVPAKKAKKK